MAGKDKRKKGKADPEVIEGGDGKPSVAAHPKAARRVRQAREAAGLAGFLLGGWLSLRTHTPASALLRALIAGAACYVVVWGAAVLLCRHLIVAEIRSREHALLEAAAARFAALTGGDPETGAGGPSSRRGGG